MAPTGKVWRECAVPCSREEPHVLTRVCVCVVGDTQEPSLEDVHPPLYMLIYRTNTIYVMSSFTVAGNVKTQRLRVLGLSAKRNKGEGGK